MKCDESGHVYCIQAKQIVFPSCRVKIDMPAESSLRYIRLYSRYLCRKAFKGRQLGVIHPEAHVSSDGILLGVEQSWRNT